LDPPLFNLFHYSPRLTGVLPKRVPLSSIRKIVNKPGYKIFRKSVRVLVVVYEKDSRFDSFEINPAIFKGKVMDEFLEDIGHRAPHIEILEMTP
jgi:hypothetical protein